MNPVTVQQRIEYSKIIEFAVNVIDSHFGSIESSKPVTFLEVGCGKGSFTNLLKENYGDKINITAIDPSPEVVDIAKKRTDQVIKFQAADIFDFKTEKKFDVVMFTKSLHHCLPVTEALKIANGLLNENGIIIAEEVFGDVMDDATLDWFFDRWDLMTQSGLFYRDYVTDPCEFEWEERLLDTSKTPRERWELFSQADCSTSKAVSKAIYSVFGEQNVKFTQDVAFWFHFLIYAGLHDNDAGNAALRELLKQEIRSIENKTIKSLGGNYVINKIN